MEGYDTADAYFSFLYLVLVLCFILPPKEFVSAGFTIQNIFASYLGSEEVDFISHHLKRTTITATLHLLIPLTYYTSLGLVSPNLHLFTFGRLSKWQALLALCCFSSAICGCLLGWLWTTSNYIHHPLAKNLSKFGTSWRVVASQINLEFRRMEKFSSVTGGTSFYVTDSWIIKCTAYNVYVSQQTDSHLSIEESEELTCNVGVHASNQILKIKVRSIAPLEQSFSIHLNAFEYNELKDRLSTPILNARRVVVHQTLSDRFVEAFREQVEGNGSAVEAGLQINDLDNCIGCMSQTANIKLVKRCSNATRDGCQQCYCRPMWCLTCMARWFASRQDQSTPEEWMGSIAPCPTCRTKFCMLDVIKI